MKRKIIIFSALVAAVLAIGIVIVFDSGPKKDSLGIDISGHTTLTRDDWDALNAKDVSFVYIKATEGSTYKDPQVVRNTQLVNCFLESGIGYYHFFRDNCNSAAQFKNFKETMDSLVQEGKKMDMNFDFGLRPVIDFEDAGLHKRISTESRMLTLKRLYNLMSKEYGKPIIYCGLKHYKLIKRHIPSADIWLSTSRCKKTIMYQFRKRVNGKLIDFNRANRDDIMRIDTTHYAGGC